MQGDTVGFLILGSCVNDYLIESLDAIGIRGAALFSDASGKCKMSNVFEQVQEVVQASKLDSSSILKSCRERQIRSLICAAPISFVAQNKVAFDALSKEIVLTYLASELVATLPSSLCTQFAKWIVCSESEGRELSQKQSISQSNILTVPQLEPWRKVIHRSAALADRMSEIITFARVFADQKATNSSASANQIRVLMNIRSNAFSNRGGDTVLLECLKAELEQQGVAVVVDEQSVIDPSGFDLVHIFNFATPEITQGFAERAVRSSVPYVVTTLNEDRPVFFNQMFALFSAMEVYLREGQPQSRWLEFERVCSIAQPSVIWDNRWTAEHAAALIATGAEEARVLQENYPTSARIRIAKLGGNTTTHCTDGGALFRREMGIDNFVLCVGRLERRKNQLMLLKALEDTDHTVVIATSGMTYEPEYVEAVKNFRRKGKTIFLPRLEADMLQSCFAAARVHALPSWYELPGLVHLEAARQGTAVVAADFGTTRDYLGPDAFYCRPDNAASIRRAIEEAWSACEVDTARLSRAKERALSWSWKATSHAVIEIYKEVLQQTVAKKHETPAHIEPSIRQATDQAYQASRTVSVLPVAMPTEPSSSAAMIQANEIAVAGEALLKTGELIEARRKFDEALRVSSHCKQAWKGLGVLLLTEQNFSEAQICFEKAMALDPRDAKAIAGKGACLSGAGDKAAGYALFVEAVQIDPFNVSALYHLLNSSYELGRFVDLEKALRRYLVEKSEDIKIRYCLAGCYVAQQKYPLAQAAVERILQLEPEHKDALELRDEVQKRIANSRITVSRGAVPFTNIVATKEGDVQQRIARIEEAKSSGQYEEVIAEALEVLSTKTVSQEEREYLEVLRGEALVCVERLDDAERCFSDLVQSRRYADRALTGRGVLAASKGDWIGARSYFTDALKVNNRNDAALAGLALCDTSSGETEAAWMRYMEALQLNAENRRALIGLAELGSDLQRLPDVEIRLEKYLEMHPLDLSVLYTSADCCYAQGKLEKALEKLNTIVLVDAGNEHARALRDRILSEQRV